ncbi:GNAT family protein [Actinoplanes sp. NPDC051411]|jgi:ribosomal-protein-alanine N-acetyltransferase|uniref:GNAT family N-acetyltransferase n=1 Tax=Actinoplanes sp. NPDC051411 TaxID=3155522 RepID=UPI003440FE7A
MYELRPVESTDAQAVLAFEQANRAYFAAFISDRGDAFFAHFADSWSTVLALQKAGTCLFHVLTTEDAEVVGRFNLLEIEDRTAEVGYRLAEHVAGRGVATAAVRELCTRAATQYGLRTLNAAAADTNPASQRVLAKAGFTVTGPARPAEVGGKPGKWYRRSLA